jgi:hypothetical protein
MSKDIPGLFKGGKELKKAGEKLIRESQQMTPRQLKAFEAVTEEMIEARQGKQPRIAGPYGGGYGNEGGHGPTYIRDVGTIKKRKD